MNSESFDLTLEQSFAYQQMIKAAPHMPADQARSLMLELAKQVYIKDNIIRDLMKKPGVLL